MSPQADYGKYYWCILVQKSLSANGEIYIHADEIRFEESGALAALMVRDGKDYLSLLIAPGYWHAVYAASVIDGAAVAVEHWKGQVIR